MTFTIQAFPAGDGDCLLVSYGDEGGIRHLLVDGGRAGAWPALSRRLSDIRDADEPLELLVLTHIDADHIEGVIQMANDADAARMPKRVWYNGYDQMGRIQAFSVAQGDQYSKLVSDRGWPLNAEFVDGVVSVEAASGTFEVAGLRITLLSPNAEKLSIMRQRWAAWRTMQASRRSTAEPSGGGVQRMGRERMPAVIDVDALAGPTPIDTEPPNGSSIAFIAEWNGRRILLAGDAHPDLLEASLAPLAEAAGGRLPIDLLKVPHHGSRGNVTRGIVELLDCRRFLISTDGRRHGHPDPQAIARLIAYSPDGPKELHFNYRTDRTQPWNAQILRERHGYETFYGDPAGFINVDI